MVLQSSMGDVSLPHRKIFLVDGESVTQALHHLNAGKSNDHREMRVVEIAIV